MSIRHEAPYTGTPYEGFNRKDWIKYWEEHATEDDPSRMRLALYYIIRSGLDIVHIVVEQLEGDSTTSFNVICEETNSKDRQDRICAPGQCAPSHELDRHQTTKEQ